MGWSFGIGRSRHHHCQLRWVMGRSSACLRCWLVPLHNLVIVIHQQANSISLDWNSNHFILVVELISTVVRKTIMLDLAASAATLKTINNFDYSSFDFITDSTTKSCNCSLSYLKSLFCFGLSSHFFFISWRQWCSSSFPTSYFDSLDSSASSLDLC